MNASIQWAVVGVMLVLVCALVPPSAAAATREGCAVEIAHHRIAVSLTAHPHAVGCAVAGAEVTTLYEDADIQDSEVVTFVSGAWHCHSNATYTPNPSYAVIACTSAEFTSMEETIPGSQITMSFRWPDSISDMSCPRYEEPSQGLDLRVTGATINPAEACSDLDRFAYVLFSVVGFGEPPSSWTPFRSGTTGSNSSTRESFDLTAQERGKISSAMPSGRYSCTAFPESKTTLGALSPQAGSAPPTDTQPVTVTFHDRTYCQRVQRYPGGDGQPGLLRYETAAWTYTGRQTGVLLWYVATDGSLVPARVVWNQCVGGNWCSPPPST